MKNKQIELESKIISLLNKDNTKKNTFHFFWKTDIEIVGRTPADIVDLEIFSCNPITNQIFLLTKTESNSKIDCLKSVIDSLKDSDEYSWKVQWSDGDTEQVTRVISVSYFRGKTKQEVIEKFNYVKSDNKIINIEKMPIS
jgi:hypothetical protein